MELFIFIVAVIGFFMLWSGVTRLRKKTNDDIDFDVSDMVSKSENEAENKIKKKLIKGKQYQFLESITLLMTSKNPDIVIARLDFAREIGRELKFQKEINGSLYSISVEETIELFKQNYYDVIIDKEAMNLLFNPEILIDQYEGEYNGMIGSALDRYFEKQQEEIEKLKTLKGKLVRYEKVIEKLKEFKEMAKSYKGTRKNFDTMVRVVKGEMKEIQKES